MDKDLAVNEAFLEIGLNALSRTKWGFSERQRKAREIIIEVQQELRRVQRLIEMESE